MFQKRGAEWSHVWRNAYYSTEDKKGKHAKWLDLCGIAGNSLSVVSLVHSSLSPPASLTSLLQLSDLQCFNTVVFWLAKIWVAKMITSYI